MASFQLGLPQMMVRIDQSRRDDLVCAVDDFGICRRDDVLGDLTDSVVSDQQGVVSQRHHAIIRLARRHQNSGILQQNMGRHFWSE